MSRQSMIAPLEPRIEPPANLGWHWIRRLSALFSKKVLGRVAAKCMMCATPTAWLQSVEPKNNMYKTKYHKDQSVTLWNVYTQTWQRVRASRISSEILASLSSAERTRIARMSARC
jgi:hypothetical protein